MIRASVLIFFSALLGSSLPAQMQFRHMHYNLTLYGNPFSCNEESNNTDLKDAALNVIVDYAQPDFITVNELGDEDALADRILDEVLNDDEALWSRAELTDQFTWSSIINGCYYRSDKFVLAGQEVVYQGLDGSSLLRPIDLYRFYMDLPSLGSGDTTFVTLIVAHLSASDEVERAEQTAATMSFLEELGPDNYIFTGDLNLDSSFEESFQNLVNANQAQLSFVDPISTASTWHNNPSVSEYHTQSTRFNDTNGGCFSGGGLDDRFDLTLVSPAVISGLAGLSYINDSYTVLGQSGNDYNQSLQTTNNQVVPDDVAQALYDMSDHLPVITDFEVNEITSISENLYSDDFKVNIIDGQLQVWLESNDRHQIGIFDVTGRLLGETSFAGQYHEWTLPRGVQGQTILIRLTDSHSQQSKRFFIQQ